MVFFSGSQMMVVQEVLSVIGEGTRGFERG